MSMLSPKRSKFRKSHKGNLKGRAKGGNEVSFGDYGLQVTSPGWLTARQIEAARVAISSDTPSTSKMIRPGRTIATHPSTPPLPVPMRVSAGFFVNGWSGNTRT